MKNLMYTVNLPALAAKIKVCVGDQEHRDNFSKRMKLDYCSRTASCHYKAGTFGAMVCILMSEDNLAGFAHEAVHAASFIQSHMGVLPHWDNDELTAYIVEHLMNTHLKKRKVQ